MNSNNKNLSNNSINSNISNQNYINKNVNININDINYTNDNNIYGKNTSVQNKKSFEKDDINNVNNQ